MSYFKDKKGLLIIGPAGSGKTTKAREIAEKESGTVSYTTAEKCFGKHFDADLDADTVVVDECGAFQPWMKSLATAENIQISKKGEAPKFRSTPNFIFCIQSADPFPLDHADRRFLVMQL